MAVLAPKGVMAQCAFNMPNGSSSYVSTISTPLMRAFVSCANPGGNAPNTEDTTGTPTCQPVETFDQQAGSPSGGWEFGPGTSYGRVTIKRSSGGPNPGNLPPTLHDAAVTLKLYHIDSTDGGRATGSGTIQLQLRATFEDYTNGDMTLFDFPFAFSFELTGSGSVSVTKKLGEVMATLSRPRFPDCTSIEVVGIFVRDRNFNVFAVPGVKLK